MADYGTITVRAVIFNHGKLLMLTNKWVPGYFVLPGGGMDPGESVTKALEREIIEELGVKPEIGQLMAIHQIKNGGEYTVPEYIFHIKNPDDFNNINLSETTHGEEEIDEFKFTDDFSKLLPQEIIPLLENIDEDHYHAATELIVSKQI